MDRLNLYLPPPAADYTGACSALYELDCLTVVMDAGGCTAHAVRWDEPRWSERVRPTVSARLRSIDTALGDDRLLADSIEAMERKTGASLIALVGTPVPAVTGMDLEGLACELEERCGVPVLGISTGGFAAYDHGLWLAGRALLDRFAGPGAADPDPQRVNVLGLSPLDCGNSGYHRELWRALEDGGWKRGASLFMGLRPEELKTVGTAAVNLAVSAPGLRLAQKLRQDFGTPCIAAFPMGTRHLRAVLGELSGETRSGRGAGGDGPRTLIVAEPVMGASLRQALRLGGLGGEIRLGSFSLIDPELREDGDVFFPSEAAFLRFLRDRPVDGLIGDPLLGAVPQARGLRFRPIPHPALSGRLYCEQVPRFLSPEFDSWLGDTVRILQEETGAG